MKPFTLFDEIYGWNHSTDDEPVPAGKTVTGPPMDLLDATRPFSELFKFSPSNGRASGLVKQIESADIMTKVLGSDLEDLLKVHSATVVPSALDDVFAKASNRILAKVTRVATNAPLHKKAVTKIVDQFKRDLRAKGFSKSVNEFDWSTLANHANEFVAQAIMND